jgi:hypothetical protein
MTEIMLAQSHLKRIGRVCCTAGLHSVSYALICIPSPDLKRLISYESSYKRTKTKHQYEDGNRNMKTRRQTGFDCGGLAHSLAGQICALGG